MVRTSNWPPLVAISLVTRWRRTFSSSVTHFTVMSGFLAVNSLVKPCMRIMSPLFTVAMVRVVCAIEGAEPNRVTAPTRALRTCFTVTSLYFALSICPRIAIMFTPRINLVKVKMGRRSALFGRIERSNWQRPPMVPGRRPRLAGIPLTFQGRACRRLVGDQPVDQTALQRRPDRRNLGSTKGCTDGQRLGGDFWRNAGQAVVCPAFDNTALRVECPTGQLTDGTEPHHFE